MGSAKNINVTFLDTINRFSPLPDISAVLNNLPKNEIGFTPWAEFQYKPECAFAIAHGNDCIFLRYFVVENDILVRYTQPNDLVYGDSCVEFFIAFDDSDEYYNLEFNSIGTCYLGYISGHAKIEPAQIEIVKTIKSSFILRSDEGKMKWELTLVIPNEVFFHHNYTSLASKTARANFYKCGDDLPVRHYLAWNNIESEKPDFHRPEFFGTIMFD